MSHKQFILKNETAPLGYLISLRKALSVLMTHKARDARFQSLLIKWVAAVIFAFAAALCGFIHLPVLLAGGISALCAGYCVLLLWFEAGDVFLQFALEDQHFFELATGCRALSIFEDSDLSLPQPGN
jgi:hypothetical protein